jgi:UDP-glucose 6-dehydrogenase
MSVPGTDGIAGARGHCFPKDLRGITFLAKALGIDAIVMEALWQKNVAVVPVEHRDWERMKGRAVSE